MSYTKINPYIYFFSNMYDDGLITDFLNKKLKNSYTNAISDQDVVESSKELVIDADSGETANGDFLYQFGIQGLRAGDYYVYPVDFPLHLNVRDVKNFITNHRKSYINTKYDSSNKDFYGYISLTRSDQPEMNSIDFTLLYENLYTTTKYVLVRKDLITPGSKLFIKWLYPLGVIYNADGETIGTREAYNKTGISVPISNISDKILKHIEEYRDSVVYNIILTVDGTKYNARCLYEHSLTGDVAINRIFSLYDSVYKEGLVVSDYEIWIMNNKRDIYVRHSSDTGRPTLTGPNYVRLGDYANDTFDAISLKNISIFKVSTDVPEIGYSITEQKDTRGTSFAYYPLVLDFNSLPTDEQLFFECEIKLDNLTSSVIYNYMRDFIRIFKSNLPYTTVVTGGAMGLEAWEKYNPGVPFTDHNDFINSEYYPDVRMYRCSRLIDLMKTEPYIYKEYLDYVFDKTGYIDEVEHIPFDDNTFNTRVRNSIISGHVFDTDHIYIKYYNTNLSCSGIFFMNGIILSPSYVESGGGVTYFYFDLQKYINIATTVSDDPGIDKTFIPQNLQNYEKYPIITAKIFLRSQNNNSTQAINTLNFATTDEVKQVFTTDTPFRLMDLLFYNRDTGEVYGLENFNFTISLTSYIMKDIYTNRDVEVSVLNSESAKELLRQDVEYLYTNDTEEYLTIDGKNIILRKESITVTTDDIIEDMNIDIHSISRKLHGNSDIGISLKNPTLLGSDIVVIDNHKTMYFDIPQSDIEINQINNTTTDLTITVKNYTGDHDPAKLILLVNGSPYFKMNSERSFHAGINFEFPTIYGGDLKIKFNGDFDEFIRVSGITLTPSQVAAIELFRSCDITVVYSPYDFVFSDFDMNPDTASNVYAITRSPADPLLDLSTVSGTLIRDPWYYYELFDGTFSDIQPSDTSILDPGERIFKCPIMYNGGYASYLPGWIVNSYGIEDIQRLLGVALDYWPKLAYLNKYGYKYNINSDPIFLLSFSGHMMDLGRDINPLSFMLGATKVDNMFSKYLKKMTLVDWMDNRALDGATP